MSDDVRHADLFAEGTGASLGEAKWAAMKELEPRFPGITAECVRFEVVEEPDGDGARVRAEVDEDAWRDAAEVIPDEPSGPSSRESSTRWACARRSTSRRARTRSAQLSTATSSAC
jgi:hypothetical protein